MLFIRLISWNDPVNKMTADWVLSRFAWNINQYQFVELSKNWEIFKEHPSFNDEFGKFSKKVIFKKIFDDNFIIKNLWEWILLNLRTLTYKRTLSQQSILICSIDLFPVVKKARWKGHRSGVTEGLMKDLSGRFN